MLAWLEDDVGRMLTGEAIHPLLRRLAPSARELGFPKRAFLRPISANRQDQEVSRYATYDQLAAYCDLSANPVGELVLYTFRSATRERIRMSDSVCTGLQLAEHWQDVGEDYRRGRIYLPQ
jgi:phytoene/squalene synthetase